MSSSTPPWPRTRARPTSCRRCCPRWIPWPRCRAGTTTATPGTRFSGLGLYQGCKLGAQSVAAYGRALNNLLLPRLLARLETQMQGNLGNTDFLYQALKVYLILGRSGPLDPGLVQQWMYADFAAAYPGRGRHATRTRARTTCRRAARTSGHRHPAERPAGRPRARHPAPDAARPRSYTRILGSEEARALPPWRYADQAGAAAAACCMLRSGKSLDTGVDGIFTFSGYHDVFAKLLPEVTDDIAEDSWVLGRPGPGRRPQAGRATAARRAGPLSRRIRPQMGRADRRSADQAVPHA